MRLLTGGTVSSAIRRTTLTAILLVLVLLLPMAASAATPIQPVAPTQIATSQFDVGADFGRDLPEDSIPADQDQPEESGKAPTVSSNLVEEEVKAKHDIADLSVVHAGSLAGSELVDHAYEGWFYSVTHPPLTPPPNAG